MDRTVSKSNLALTSLVAALPAAFLAYLLVMTLLSGPEQLGGTLMGLVVAALLCAVVIALMPVGVLVLGPKSGATAPRKAKQKAAEEDTFEDAEPTEPVDELSDDEENVLVEETTIDEELYVEEGDAEDDFLANFDEEEPPAKKRK
jgi:hypothetical protein